MPPEIDIARSLAGERILVTGATGFVGKVLVEKLLWSVPEVERLVLLVRDESGPDGRSAAGRVEDEIFGSPAMARLRARHGTGWPAWAAAKVEVVAGDLGAERFGLASDAWEALCRRVDRVVAAAATVAFDERLDRALETNARGARRALELARTAGPAAGGAPLVHVSTCFVGGRGGDEAPETLPELDAAPDDLLAELDATCRRLAATAADRDADADDAAWIDAGRQAAARHGFPDVYTLTKALGEHLVARERGAVPTAIVRPAIVESAFAEPIPGWIEAVRVVDPLLVAYGRGLTGELPGRPETRLELVPVDLVANAILAALAELSPADDGAGAKAADEPPRIYQIASGRNPVTLGEVLHHARCGFLRAPLRDDRGEPVEPRPARLVEPERLERRIVHRLERLRARRRRLEERRSPENGGGRDGRDRPGDRRAERLRVAERRLEHFLRLLEVYRPYLGGPESAGRFRDEATVALHERLAPASREAFPFDIAEVDWPGYLARTHVPGLVRFALRAEAGEPVATGEESSDRSDRQELLRRASRHAAAAGDLYELFARVARGNPRRVAFQTHRDGRWLRYDYGRALAAAELLARHLADRHGIGAGDAVALWSSGRPEWTIAALALWRLGAVVVPLDPQWPAGEAAAAARFADARLVCAAPELATGAADAWGCPVVPLAAPFVPEPDAFAPADAEAAAAAAAGRRPVGEAARATLLFTSGTTVAPKAVPLTHGNYLANVRDLVPVMELAGERLLSVLPVHHAFEQTVGHLVPIAGAGTISYVAALRPDEISWMMQATRPTVLVAVPRLLELLHGGIRRTVEAGGPTLRRLFGLLSTLSRLTGERWGHRLFGKVHRRFGGALRRIATGGSPLDPELGRSFRRMGFAVAEGYGMTETAPVLAVNPWRAIRFGSVGRPLPGVDIELRPPAADSELAAAGLEPGVGEVWVRGANVMEGYLGDPATNARVLRDGWLATGDLGRFDADGYLHLVGRTKDVIVTAAGKTIYPEEVEARYREIEGVEELHVLGLPRAEGAGEQVAAVVVPSVGVAGAAAHAEALRRAIDERSASLPSHQRIERLVVWRGEVPKTTTLKVKRAVLRDAVLAGEPAARPPERPRTEAGANGGTRSSASEAERWLLATLGRLLHRRPEQLEISDRLGELGVDSLMRIELGAALEARSGRRPGDAALARAARVGDLLELVAEPAGDRPLC